MMLAREGVAVLVGVLDADEIQGMQEGMWETLSSMTAPFARPVVRGEPATYGTVRSLMPNHGYLFQGWPGLAHRQHIWDVRQNPKVAGAFAEIWGCGAEELLCSFDAVSMGVAHLAEGGGTGWERGHKWEHMDQAPTRVGFECVQGWVTGEDIEPGDATLLVRPGSHRLGPGLVEKFGITETKDWYKLKVEERAWFAEQGCEDLRILAPAGSLVLWDSRTVHSGSNPMKEAVRHKPRNVIYVCMQPRLPTVKGMGAGTEKRRASTKEMQVLARALKKRREIFDPTNEAKFLRMTTHWPRKTLLFGKYPRSYGPKPAEWEQVPKGETPTLTALGRKLAGLD